MNPLALTLLQRPFPKVYLTDLREDTTALTTYTFTNCQVNIPSQMGLPTGDTGQTEPWVKSTSHGWVLVNVHMEDALATFSVSTVTIGGVSLTSRVDQLGSGQALDSAIFGARAATLGAITDTNIVVTASEAVTGCAIGVLYVDSIMVGSSNSSTSGAVASGGTVTLNPSYASPQTEGINTAMIIASTNATGTAVWRPNINLASGLRQLEVLYDQGNANFAYAGAYAICGQAVGAASNVAAVISAWSTGAQSSCCTVTS